MYICNTYTQKERDEIKIPYSFRFENCVCVCVCTFTGRRWKTGRPFVGCGRSVFLPLSFNSPSLIALSLSISPRPHPPLPLSPLYVSLVHTHNCMLTYFRVALACSRVTCGHTHTYRTHTLKTNTVVFHRIYTRHTLTHCVYVSFKQAWLVLDATTQRKLCLPNRMFFLTNRARDRKRGR